jgi:hypothetical protein
MRRENLIYCGIDWAEKTHDVALVDDTGQLLAKRHITDDAAGYQRQPARATRPVGGPSLLPGWSDWSDLPVGRAGTFRAAAEPRL